MISHAFVAQGLERCSCKPAVESLFSPRAIFIVILVFSPQWNLIPEFPRNYILKHLKFIINYYLTCLRSYGVRALVL